jgi:hypothetical protein
MRTASRIIAVILIFLLSTVGVLGQHAVYKWVDKDGVVHYSDEPPDESEAVLVEQMTIAETPAPSQPYQPPVREPTETRKQDEGKAAYPASPASPESPDIDISTLSFAELDRRCEAEREAKIAPLRKIEIDKCIDEQRKDPAYCNRFYADYGAGGRTSHGAYRVRMFNDLPVCLEAERKRH